MILPSARAKDENAERSNPTMKVLDGLLVIVFLIYRHSLLSPTSLAGDQYPTPVGAGHPYCARAVSRVSGSPNDRRLRFRASSFTVAWLDCFWKPDGERAPGVAFDLDPPWAHTLSPFHLF